MKILVKNFKRVERSEMESNGIILLAGQNGAGKSSTLTAIGMAALGDATPLDRNKSEAASLVLHGQEEAEAVIDYGESVIRAVWPKAKVFKEGTPPSLSAFAIGLDSICEMSPAEISQTFGPLIKATPTKADLKSELDDLRIDGAVVEKVWDKIEADGFEAAHEQSKNAGIKLKGLWETTTGDGKYGTEKAETWRPKGWDEERHSSLTLDQANDALAAAEAALRDGITNAALDADRLATLKEAAEKLPGILTDLEAAQKDAADLQKQFDTAEAERRALPASQGDSPEIPCPSCGTMLMLRNIPGGVKIEESKLHEMNDEARKEMRLKVADLDGKIANLRPRLKAADTKVGTLQERQNTAEKAVKDYEAAAKKKGTANVDTLKAAESAARADADIVRVNGEARSIATRIAVNVKLTALLGPGGLRAKVLRRQLEVFNREHVAPLVAFTKWPPIILGQDLVCTFGGIRWRDLGESHRWIVRAVMQAAISRVEGAPFILIDRADVCDARNRSGLFSMLMEAKIKAVVGMTANAPDNSKQVPDLAASKVGATYWIAEGRTAPLKQAIEAMEKKA